MDLLESTSSTMMSLTLQNNINGSRETKTTCTRKNKEKIEMHDDIKL